MNLSTYSNDIFSHQFFSSYSGNKHEDGNLSVNLLGGAFFCGDDLDDWGEDFPDLTDDFNDAADGELIEQTGDDDFGQNDDAEDYDEEFDSGDDDEDVDEFNHDLDPPFEFDPPGI